MQLTAETMFLVVLVAGYAAQLSRNGRKVQTQHSTAQYPDVHLATTAIKLQ